MIISVATIGIRCDILAVLYGIFLIATLLMERREIARIWPYYTTFLAVILSVQYLLCLGIPKIFCKGRQYYLVIQIFYINDSKQYKLHVYFFAAYPWSSWDSNMIEWLFLPDHTVSPNPVKIWGVF